MIELLEFLVVADGHVDLLADLVHPSVHRHREAVTAHQEVGIDVVFDGDRRFRREAVCLDASAPARFACPFDVTVSDVHSANHGFQIFVHQFLLLRDSIL